jgi:hypothetical protein
MLMRVGWHLGTFVPKKDSSAAGEMAPVAAMHRSETSALACSPFLILVGKTPALLAKWRLASMHRSGLWKGRTAARRVPRLGEGTRYAAHTAEAGAGHPQFQRRDPGNAAWCESRLGFAYIGPPPRPQANLVRHLDWVNSKRQASASRCGFLFLLRGHSSPDRWQLG